MLQIGLILLLARLSRRRRSGGRPPSAGATRSIRTVAVAASVMVLATIVAGGYMAASELQGTGREHASPDPHVACGTDFPSCNGGFLPFGQSRSLDIHLTHRAFMYLITGGVASALQVVPIKPLAQTIGLLADAASPVASFTIGASSGGSQFVAARSETTTYAVARLRAGGADQAAGASAAGVGRGASPSRSACRWTGSPSR